MLENEAWDFNKESYLIGHSSGAMAILGLLQALPERVMVDTCILVGAFRNSLGDKNLEEIYWGASFWADSYLVKSVGYVTDKVVSNYVKKQRSV